nr:protein defective in meristem silencing 3-like isoform X1 [Tanacetum cinerariifolium]
MLSRIHPGLIERHSQQLASSSACLQQHLARILIGKWCCHAIHIQMVFKKANVGSDSTFGCGSTFFFVDVSFTCEWVDFGRAVSLTCRKGQSVKPLPKVAAIRSAFEEHRHEQRFEQITIVEIERWLTLRVLIPETTFVGVESRVSSPETTFVESKSEVEDDEEEEKEFEFERFVWLRICICLSELNLELSVTVEPLDVLARLFVILGESNLSSTPMLVDGEDHSHKPNQKETVEHIMQLEKSAAGVVCQLQHHADLASSTNDVLGDVATLGKVNDDDLSRILSEYLGLDTMLSLVCTTYKGVEALESYDKEGLVCKNSGLHRLAASVGRTIDGRFNVFCLENLRPYVGEFIPDDPQRRLALVKPKLPNGATPEGFLGFAALPFLSDGAISLDGGIIRSNGVYVIGTCRDEMDVKFGISSCLPENLDCFVIDIDFYHQEDGSLSV